MFEEIRRWSHGCNTSSKWSHCSNGSLLYGNNITLANFVISHCVFDATENVMKFFLANGWLPTEDSEFGFTKSLSSLALNWEGCLSGDTSHLAINIIGWMMFDQPGRRSILRVSFRLVCYLFLVRSAFNFCGRLELHNTKIVPLFKFPLYLILYHHFNSSLPFYFSLVIVLYQIRPTRYCFME